MGKLNLRSKIQVSLDCSKNTEKKEFDLKDNDLSMVLYDMIR